MRKVSKRSFVREMMSSERGDTNFISIIIILAIVAVVGSAFFLLVKTFMPKFFASIKEFFNNVTTFKMST